MNDKLAQNVAAYRTPKALELYTSYYGLYPIEEHIVQQHFPPTGRILDHGCGGGRTSVPLHELGYAVTAVDLSDVLIGAAKKRFPYVDFRVGSYSDMEFDNEYFDVVLISHNGLDYAHPEEERNKALRECARVLKKGGKLVFSSHNIKSLHFSPYYYRPLSRLTWMLRNWPSAFRDHWYILDINGQWTFFGSREYVCGQAAVAGLEVVDVIGSRLSRNPRFIRISPYVHYVCVKK